jgi:hypothetical protein
LSKNILIISVSYDLRLFLSAELQRFEQGPVVYHEENEMERAWRDYRLEKDFPHETE